MPGHLAKPSRKMTPTRSRTLVLFGDWEQLEAALKCHHDLAWIWSLETDRGHLELFKKMLKRDSPIEQALQANSPGAGWSREWSSFSNIVDWLKLNQHRRAPSQTLPSDKERVKTSNALQIQIPQNNPGPGSDSKRHAMAALATPKSDSVGALQENASVKQTDGFEAALDPPSFLQLILKAREVYQLVKEGEEHAGDGQIENREKQKSAPSAHPCQKHV